MARSRTRSPAGVAGRILLGVVLAVLIAGVVLVALAYYTPLEFDVEAVALALVVAGGFVVLWMRWR